MSFTFWLDLFSLDYCLLLWIMYCLSSHQLPLFGVGTEYDLILRLNAPHRTDTLLSTVKSPSLPCYRSTSQRKSIWLKEAAWSYTPRSNCINPGPCGPSRTRLSNQPPSNIIHHSNQCLCCWSVRAGTDEWKSTVCVLISHLPLYIIWTNCPVFDSNLFLWFWFPTLISNDETPRKKEHEDKSEKRNILPSIAS